ncbi:MAG: urease accessory protein UreD [Cellulomonas sp.]|uniref:urease accessory protein UreD n=1 Tax=Cellulomonas sp. TaxID=40001 RepID=UPI0019FB9EAE|nr:urease accessory protein UreD [Cellulomonas sp.]MBF0689156.1 urease accessory protein UreD [Cellulomonas sp.]
MDILQVTTHEPQGVRTTGRPVACRTRVAVTAEGDVELAGDLVSARRLPAEHGRARVALLAPPAPVGGDLRIEVDVAPGRALEIVESTRTGTHDVNGPRTTWLAHVRLGQDAVLIWPSLPVVVGDGADVLRLTHVELAQGARVVLRETLVLGRTGEAGGRVRTTVRARLADRPLLSETFVAEPAPPMIGELDAVLDAVSLIRDPQDAMAAAHRDRQPPVQEQRLDTLLVLGARLHHPDALQLEREGTMLRGPEARAHDGDLAGLIAPYASFVLPG